MDEARNGRECGILWVAASCAFIALAIRCNALLELCGLTGERCTHVRFDVDWLDSGRRDVIVLGGVSSRGEE